MRAPAEGGTGRRLAIVLLLVAVLVMLHRFAAVREGAPPSTMLAFGFVVLASYAIGQLVEVVRLPHITGYLLAGVVLGPSFAGILPETLQVPPFDRGVLSVEVIAGLSVLDTLAVALIALTAGGELELGALRRGGRAIAGILLGQALLVLPAVTALVFAMGGSVEGALLPGLPVLPASAVIALAMMVASIAYATSPAATIAVINDTGAQGPLSRTVLSSVVLKDILVVILFSVASTYAVGQLGLAAQDGSLGGFIAVRVGGSIVVGAMLGFGVAQYFRWVNREPLLFLVATVYATTLIARMLQLDPVLLFIATGFAAANFSKEADKLIENVERLSMPVYVVFFTLAGARLHLDHLAHVAPFAVALFVVRAGSFWAGTKLGALVGGAGSAMQRFGWMGYLSQAGVAISLSGMVGARFGEAGRALETLIISMIALNELVGPVLLKVSLTLSGESAARRQAQSVDTLPTNEPSPARPPTEAWADRQAGEQDWGPPASSETPALGAAAAELRRGLDRALLRLDEETLTPLAEQAQAYLSELRQDLLRFHRRLAVQARAEDSQALQHLLHVEQAELADRWRAVVLGRAAHVTARATDLRGLARDLDRLIDEVPEQIEARVDASTYHRRATDSTGRAARRLLLRLRRSLGRALGSGDPTRLVPLRALALYHLGSEALVRAEGLSALLVQGELHLASRVRSVFEGLLREPPAQLSGEAIRVLFDDAEAELALGSDEVDRMHEDLRQRARSILIDAQRRLEVDLAVIDTPDLAARKRHTSRVFAQRVSALEALGPRMAQSERMVGARLSALALELELYGLEARIRDALGARVQELARDVRGRSHLHVERVGAALERSLQSLEALLSDVTLTGDATASALRSSTAEVEHASAEAASAALLLRDQLRDEQGSLLLLDTLRRAVRDLTDVYTVPRGRIEQGEWRLPPPVTLGEITFRQLVATHVEVEIAPRLATATRELAERVQPLIVALQDLERLVAFDNELARGELELVRDAPVPPRTRQLLGEVFLAGLARARDNVRGYQASSAGWPAALSDQLHQAVRGAITTLRQTLGEGGYDLRAVRAATIRGRWLATAGKLPSRFEVTLGDLGQAVQRGIGTPTIEHWRSVLGWPARRPGAGGGLAFEPPRAPRDLPMFYGRLFSADTLEAADVITGREETIERARRALIGGRPGLRSVALVGLDGVGKGTLSAAISRALDWKNVRRHTFSAPVGVEEVEAIFSQPRDGHLVVISGFHWLISAGPRGFDGLRRLVEGVLADDGRSAFLVHADRLVWDHACEAAPLAEAFTEVIEVPALSPSELEAAVRARHALSGHRLDFSGVARHTGSSSLLARDETRAQIPVTRYFRALHAASGGLVRDALRLWLASIERVDEAADTVFVSGLPRSPLPALRALDRETLVRLYPVARQGWIDKAGTARLFLIDEVTAEAELVALARRGLLERDGRAYRVPSHLRGSVYRLLVERGWV